MRIHFLSLSLSPAAIIGQLILLSILPCGCVASTAGFSLLLAFVTAVVYIYIFGLRGE